MKNLRLLKINPLYIFLLILVGLALLYNYHHILFMRPLGIHQWRSCVSAAFPVNLAKGGSFFTTQTHALLADNFTSDITVVEFPLVYYIISLFYRVFGVNEFWFRMIQTAIGFMGLAYLYKASYHFTKDAFFAAFVPLIIFTSPVYVFYLSGFIPDSVALSLTFGGFWYFLKYSENRKSRTWLLSMFFFALAGLTKTSSLLPYIGIGALALLELFQRMRNKEGDALFRFSWLSVVSFIGVLALVFAWYLYAKIYSDLHAGSVSAVEIRPIWELDQETIQSTLKRMKYWFGRGDYHATWFLYLSLAIFVFNLFFPRRANPFLYRFSILVFLGAFAFTLLFFKSMKNHDYYQINNFFVYIPVYLTFFSIMASLTPRFYASWWPKLILLIPLIFLTLNCKKLMDYRYNERDGFYAHSLKNVAMYDIEAYLDEIGVDKSSKVHCYPDQSINISLYLCNRKGLTNFGPMRHMSIAERVEECRKLGIEYMILGSRDDFPEEDLDLLLPDKIGAIGTTEIFRLN